MFDDGQFGVGMKLLLLASVSETAHYSCQWGKKSKILSDVRLEACAVEHYPGWLRRQSCANHMADI